MNIHSLQFQEISPAGRSPYAKKEALRKKQQGRQGAALRRKLKEVDMEEKFVFKGITIPVSHFNKEGVICPFCKSLQKRYISHIRKEHRRSNPDISSNQDFEEFEKHMRTFINKLKQRECRDGQKEKDAEGFAAKHKEEQRKYVDGQKEKDAEGFSSKQKEKQRKYLKAKRQLEPEKLKSDQKKWNEKRAEKNKGMEDGVKKFQEEIKYGAIFPCVCRTDAIIKCRAR